MSAPFTGTERFRVRALLGEGATGSVYRVSDQETGRDVALKTLHGPSHQALLSLKREFRTRAGLVHPHLVQLHELFVEGESHFFTMDLVEGVDFLQWTRGTGSPARGSTLEDAPVGEVHPPPLRPPAPGFSLERLSRGLVQILQALGALHAARLVHRDIKPSNVLVTPEERVLVLDFGLTSAMEFLGAGPSRARRPVGTPAYMAPEQVTGDEVGPPADLYALGAMLYEVLTGAPPFATLGGNLLEHKVRRDPPHVRELAPRADESLARLTLALLARDPAHRPDVRACLALLIPRTEPSPWPLTPDASAPRFIGREPELAALTHALEEVSRRGRQVTVHLHGPSGIGKSTLARHFLSHAPGARAPLVLHGRCHPQESVPYKALDAAVDALARHLESLPAAELVPLVPAHAPALVRLFPVLGRLAAFSREPPAPTAPDVTELRRQGAEALREVLERLARGGRPLVMWLDDVQWADGDSTPLFEALLRPPAPPFLLLLTWRTEDRDASLPLRQLLALTRDGSTRELGLGGLPPSEAEALVASLLGPTTPPATREAILAQAGGNPFLTRELALSAAHGGPSVPGVRVDVARLVLERVRELPEGAGPLLEVASLAGRPLPRAIALRAAGLGEAGRGCAAALRDAGLLREVPGGGEPGVGAAHDRLREALLGVLPAEVRVRRHRAVAEALAALAPEDDDALLLHWEGAGESQRAGHHAVRAAERAARALAFGNAAALFRKGLALGGPEMDRPQLQVRLAEALANQGRAQEAAGEYLEAARAHAGAREQDLRRRASEQYLKSGHFEEGWRELHPVLRSLGVRVPGSFNAAVWAATWRRLLFLARPVDLENLSSATESSAEARHVLEVLWSACTSWTMVNPMLADTFRTQHLLAARRLGEPTALSRAMALEATMEMHTGGRRMEASAARLLEQVRQRTEREGTPYDRAWYGLALVNRGYTRGHWHEVVREAERAEALFREHCPGSGWERVTLAIFHHHALAMRGQLRALGSRLDTLAREARESGDLHARCEAYLGEPVVAWLARDRADEAWTEAAEAMAAQSPRTSAWPESAYRRQHFAHLIATVYTAHYQGRPWVAWRAVLEQWEPLRRSFMLTLRTTGLNLRHLRARAALAAAESLGGDSTPVPEGVAARWRRGALLGDAREQVRALEKDPLGCARPLAGLVRAGLAWQERDGNQARHHLEASIAGLEREDMALYREATRWALGRVLGGETGRGQRDRARAWMEAQGVVRPEALAAALVPGLGLGSAR